MIVSGPTQCGKTSFVLRLIDNLESAVEPLIRKILYCYNEYQPDKFDTYRSRVQFYKGLPSLQMFDGREPTLVIIDDLMGETNSDVSELFTRVSHHRDLSVVFLTQNLFAKNPHFRTISLNAHYIVLYKNPRDAGQFEVLARQMYGSRNHKFALESFADATRVPHGYLFVDLKPTTEDDYRLRTGIFPDEQTYVYVDRSLYIPDIPDWLIKRIQPFYWQTI